MIQRLMRAGWRQFTLFGAMGLFALLITQNLVHYQVAEHDRLARAATDAFDQPLPDPAPRGSIFDATGAPLVTGDTVYTLHADPSVLVKGRDAAVAKLMPILRLDRATLTRDLTYRGPVSGAQYVLIADGLSSDTADAIRKLGLSGMRLERHPRAQYLSRGLAAPLLGYVDKGGAGRYGIEEAYDAALRGRDGTRLNLAAASTRLLPESARPHPYVPGADITLTINATIQQIVETRLQEELTRTHARHGTAIVMDPKTGAILAMASLPSYDPTNYSGVKNPDLFKNWALLHYQPGSTFKILSMAAGFDAGAFNTGTTVYDTGTFQSPDYQDVPIHNWEAGGWGWETPEIMLRHSANVGMVQFVQKIQPAQKYYDYLVKRFGFSRKTGLGLYEEAGAVRQADGGHWQSLDLLVNSYGQSVDVTPLQMVVAVGALANGGKRMQPYVVQKIVYFGNHVQETQPRVVAQAVSPSTADTITGVLHRSGLSQDIRDANPYGNSEATCALTDGFPVAAKTGTTTVDTSATGVSDLGKGTVASLVGYAPVDNPRFVMLVTVDHPQTLSTDSAGNNHIYGAVTAAPVWHDIAERLYPLLGIAPQPNYPDPPHTDIPRMQGPQGWGCEFDKPSQP